MSAPEPIDVELRASSLVAPAETAVLLPAGHHLATDWFDPRPYLGERGYKHITIASRLLASAMVDLEGALPPADARQRTGVVIGTNYANLDVLAAFSTTIATRGAQSLSPMESPNFSVNVPASQLSIRHGLHAFNITLTQDTRAGVDAVIDAVRLLQLGRADAVVAGSVEPTLPVSYLSRLRDAPASSDHLGSCLFVLNRSVAKQAAGCAVIRTRRAGILADEASRNRFLDALLKGLAPLAGVVLCSPPGASQDFNALGSTLDLAWTHAPQCSVPALSCLTAVAEMSRLSRTPGRHLLLCGDRYGAVSGIVLNTTTPDPA